MGIAGGKRQGGVIALDRVCTYVSGKAGK